MNNRESSAEGLLNSAYARKAIQLLEAGIPPRKVIDKLFQEGMAPEKAHTLINEQTQLPITYSKKIGKIKMLAGLLLTFGPTIYITFRANVSKKILKAHFTLLLSLGSVALYCLFGVCFSI